MMTLADAGYGGSSGLAGQDALVVAAQWLQSLLLGSIATVIAVIAIAVVGLMMLDGRIDIRRGMRTILGCFLLFGAPTIAAGLSGAAGDTETLSSRDPILPATLVQAPTPAPPTRPATPYDPYAGASVPTGN